MTSTSTESIEDFFDRYTGYLSSGDIDALADIYHYPALAVSPRGCLAVTDPQQTRDFFSQGRQFYRSRGIQGVRAKDIVTDIEGNGIWVGHLLLENLDADGRPVGVERNAYQIVLDADGASRIAVTTPLDGV
jgi:ketosteroid isomerase-like protein